ncbi:MAG: dTDP-4-dehydrorhamnose 3,5-epimerase [Bacteroidales bacterium]|nr:dTDP-4-dehydrorhamnose 3,5-epimerase [Bacteroidales bacterium]
MRVVKTPIEGLLVVEPSIYYDNRGYFFESYNEKVFRDIGIYEKFVQDNESYSTYGVIRGLHYQIEPFAQAKLVRVSKGKVWDVAVDLRKNSPTFGKWFGIELNDENKRMLFIPRGMAHGFSVLSDTAIFIYKCDNFYHKDSERGICFNDEHLNIDWKLPSDKYIISDKDKQLPKFIHAQYF